MKKIFKYQSLTAALTMPLILASLTGCKDKSEDDPKPDNGGVVENPVHIKRTDNLQIASISDEKKTEIGDATNGFAWSLLSEASRATSREDAIENVFVSPLSLALDLGMLQNAANGETLDEIIKAMGLDGSTSSEVNAYFTSVINELANADKDVELNIANAAYYNTNLVPSFSKDYTNFITESYDALVKGGAFDETMVKEINEWSNKQTNGRIPEILSEKDLNPQRTVFALLNAIYFKGKFTQPLEANSYKWKFTNAKGEEVKQYYVDTERRMKYYENAELQFTEIPIKSGAYTAFFVLPAEGKSLEATADYLANNWSNVTKSIDTYDVIFSAPRFKVNYTFGGKNMQDALGKLGITTMYSSKADFYNFFDEDVWAKLQAGVYVSDVTQKTFFELSDKGVEAAATTVILGELTSSAPPKDPKEMRLTRPFIFGVREVNTGVILFNGFCNDPTIEEIDSTIEEDDR